MKIFLSVALLFVLSTLVAGQSCVQETNCFLAQQCVCSSTTAPISETIPQLVVVAFNDAVGDLYYTSYYSPLLSGRSNPNEGSISATFYVPHEYTDYSRVNDLYNAGFEIAVHTITKDSSSEYWANAEVSTLVQEFEGQREIISTFANIPKDDVIGARVPNFQLAGDNLFEAYVEAGIEYDNTWTSRSTQPFFPFSMDYVNSITCIIGECPTNTYPGIWAAPVIDLQNQEGLECNNLLGCMVSGTVEEISDWLYEEFLAVYENNRAPITLNLNAAWFLSYANSFEAMQDFLDRIGELNDVYLVSHKQVIDYMKDPVPLESYTPSSVGGSATCSKQSCPLDFQEGVRYMVSCVACPDEYPWLGNPSGESTY